MAHSSLNREWVEFANSTPAPAPCTVDEYVALRATRGCVGQEFLKQDALKVLVDRVEVENTHISLPEVVGHEFRVRIYRPRGRAGEKLPVMLYFHGGYWSGGDLNSEDLGCRAVIARGADVVILSFDYRSVKEVQWNTMISDAEYAMKWLASHAEDIGGDTSLGYLVSGAEAGSQIAAACTVRARDKYPNICITGQILIVPTLVSYPDPQLPARWKELLRSHTEHEDAPVMNQALHEKLIEALGMPDDAKREGHNFPMWAKLNGLPPVYLAMDECDPTRDHGFLYDLLLREAGVRTRIDYYAGLPNMFVQFPNLPTTAIAGFHLSAGVKWLLKPGPPAFA